MLMSATITTEKCDWPSQGLYVVCQQDDVPRVVKCIHMDKPVLALMHVWPCHAYVSRVKQGSLENVEVATLVFEAC